MTREGTAVRAPLALVSFKLGDETSSLMQIPFNAKRSQLRVRGRADRPLSYGRVMRYLGSFRVSAAGSRGAALEVTAAPPSKHAGECGAAHPELSSAAGELSKTWPLPGVPGNASNTTELSSFRIPVLTNLRSHDCPIKSEN